ncbi:DNA replication protein DnaD, partial [Anaerosolibacter carboniphilus]|nr:DNA replication protein DnaD [Anaerosolibacter carboniphilus]
MQGWIKLHRELLVKPIWTESTPEQKTILITLLMMANHKEKEWEWKGQKYKARPGQFVTSLESIAKKSGLGISIKNVRTALKRFEKYEFLANESTNKNRLIT